MNWKLYHGWNAFGIFSLRRYVFNRKIVHCYNSNRLWKTARIDENIDASTPFTRDCASFPRIFYFSTRLFFLVLFPLFFSAESLRPPLPRSRASVYRAGVGSRRRRVATSEFSITTVFFSRRLRSRRSGFSTRSSSFVPLLPRPLPSFATLSRPCVPSRPGGGELDGWRNAVSG